MKKQRFLWVGEILLMVAGLAWAGTVSEQPNGWAFPKWYSFSDGAKSTYYLEHPTLTGNDQVVSEDATQTLTNKTLTSPTITGGTLDSPTLATPNLTTPAITGGSVAGTITSDITLATATGNGQAAAVNQFIGVPRIKMVALSTMTNGTTHTQTAMDDTPAADWGAEGGTTDPTDTEDATVYRVGTKSLKLAWLNAAVDGDGVKDTISSADFEDEESIGFWFYADATIASADFEIVFTDDGGGRTYSIPAYATINTWQWMEIDIAALTGGTGDAITEIKILISAQGAAAVGDINMYIDGAWIWDAADEEALGVAIQTDGVCGVIVNCVTSAGPSGATLAENTDFFIHYEDGVDFIVTVTDQSGTDKIGTALVAY